MGFSLFAEVEGTDVADYFGQGRGFLVKLMHVLELLKEEGVLLAIFVSE